MADGNLRADFVVRGTVLAKAKDHASGALHVFLQLPRNLVCAFDFASAKADRPLAIAVSIWCGELPPLHSFLSRGSATGPIFTVCLLGYKNPTDPICDLNLIRLSRAEVKYDPMFATQEPDRTWSDLRSRPCRFSELRPPS